MRRSTRRKLEMAAGARDFTRSHPSTSARQVALLAQLDELLSRSGTLAIQERAGRLEELAAANRRQTLRRSAQMELLFHLVRVGQQAGLENPALAGKFHLRSPDATHSSFLISTKQQLALAEANKELMVSLGLTDTVLDELKELVAQFEEAMVSGRAGLLAHIRASKDLIAVADEAVKIVGQLHGLNRYRFRRDPTLLAAWERVRFIGPKVRAEPKAPAKDPATPTEGGETPPPGGVAPAA